ncbi:P-loop containing NTPase [Amycolatopsis mediterranei S699]|uniref:p-loop containing NTPase n=2 Tax=Amycolatopsis mediterranei TaxID=33910 RepID=A0A0H3CX21_AMYMU|nr:NACHT domain-containing protein [Amycolatopsis mediterranei]ADJ43197.1 P-loop containing NTPase [Amycolatopsis mediterranei U32]AEK39895.1 P-loop containing NTPase [Amycolatopsis mediterranei S699]AFO74911.1 P-loop containing NTPase [Amycolatopsis mediterranei S699]AGT82040.1 P-loop containing NTPase [Amycolatopsis mediterranei RB]KDO05109.1 P-loop containing NTPase [Amycolatopsis mediterranei]
MIVSVGITILGTALLLVLGPTGIGIANVVAVPVGIFGILATVLVGQKRAGDAGAIPDAVILDLARKVLQRERVALAAALGVPGEVVPATIGLRQPPLVYWHTDGGGRRSSSREVAGYYTDLDRGRLVVVGGPGAGKSILATCLCIDLAAAAIGNPSGEPVPVKLSLLRFNPGGSPHDQPGSVAARLLEAWIVRSLTEMYGIEAKMAARLVGERRIVPVLDGLDEMDARQYRPARAAELVRALNHFSSGELPRFVLTSRPGCFDRLTKPPGDQEAVPLQHATVIELEPLKRADVIAYLKYRFPDPAGSPRAHARWQPIITELRSGKETPLKQAMTVPLYLFLLTAAYRSDDSRPAEILRLTTVDEVRDRLFELLVVAGAERNGQVLGSYRHLPPERAMHWLENLAEAQVLHGTIAESSIDIQIPRIHRIGGRLPRLLAAFVMGAVLLPTWLLCWSSLEDGFTPFAYLVMILAAIATQMMGVNVGVPRINATQLRKLSRNAAFLVSFAGLTVSSALMFSGSKRVSAIAASAWLLFSFFFLMGPVTLFRSFRDPGYTGQDNFFSLFQNVGAADAARLVRSGVVATAVSMATVLTMLGPLVIFTGASLARIAFTFGFLSAMLIALSPWLLYGVAALTFRFSGRFAPRPARFLDWAQAAGLIGVYGDVLRFRHREFQAWLTKRRIPVDLSTEDLAERLELL